VSGAATLSSTNLAPTPTPTPSLNPTPTPTPSPTPGNSQTCTTSTVNVENQVKILFVVDTSGSNASTPASRGVPATIGTDNNKVWRLKTINDFINAYSSNPNFYFGLITFQGSAATPQIASGGQGIFSNDQSVVQQGITNFVNTPDGNSTPYRPALMMAQAMIAADLAKNPSSTTAYVVVMISDGEPTDSLYLKASTGITSLDSDVSSVTSVAPSQISINTVYLFNPAAPSGSDTKYLQAIASTGDGAFVQASSEDTLSIENTVQVPTEVCQ